MIALALLLAAQDNTTVAEPVETIADYFPVEKGMVWTYQEKGAQYDITVIDRAKGLVIIGETGYRAIESFSRGDSLGSTYYIVTKDTVSVGALVREEPIASPYPIFKLPAGDNSTWEYTGLVPATGTTDQLVLKGRAKRTTTTVLGKEGVPAIEVVLDLVLGRGDTMVTLQQTSTYAKGYGLIETREKSRMTRNTYERTRVLTAFSAGDR